MPRADSPVTLRDVAATAGVSIATTSRVLSGRGDLSAKTRERVLDAAKTLGYHRPARHMGRPTTSDGRIIELVLSSFDDAWTNTISIGARQAAFRLGYDLVLTQERPDPDDDWPARVATRRPAGVVLGIIRPTQAQLGQLKGLRIPVVLIDPRSDPHGELASVGTTDWQGGYEAGGHLASSPAERFVVIAGTPNYRFGRAREEGFRTALADVRPGATVTTVASQWSRALFDDALLEAIDGPDRVGVFACNDEMALTAYRAAERLGRTIPGDLFVVGFNDEPRSAHAEPPLTSIRQPLREMAARAVEVVHGLRGHDQDHFERVELPCELVVRASSTSRP